MIKLLSCHTDVLSSVSEFGDLLCHLSALHLVAPTPTLMHPDVFWPSISENNSIHSSQGLIKGNILLSG